MKTVKVKNNSKYEKEIGRSFAVIYHNLKRIQDESSQVGLTRRTYSEPVGPAPNPELLKYEQTHSRQKSHSESRPSSKAPDPKQKRKVSFSDLA